MVTLEVTALKVLLDLRGYLVHLRGKVFRAPAVVLDLRVQ
jgi:hypothetical protein